MSANPNRALWLALLLPLMLGPTLTIAQETAAAPAAETASDLPAISVSVVESLPMRDIVVATGLVAAAETVLVAPLVEGQQIEALLADVGQEVKQGQVLARLSTATLTLQKNQLEASLVSVRSNADEARKAADRVAALFKGGNASSTANDQAKAALTAATAQLNQLESQLENVNLMLSRTEVVAPVSGTITARNAQQGAIASAGAPAMFQIVRDGALELRADVSQVDLMRIAVGQKVTLRTAGVSTQLEGTVALIEPAIDPASRLGRIRVAVPDRSLARPGMFMEAEILVAERKTLAVPVSAIGAADEGLTVMRLDAEDKVMQTPVVTGIREGGLIEISEGLAEGDRIVTKAGAFVRSGDRIRPIPADPAISN